MTSPYVPFYNYNVPFILIVNKLIKYARLGFHNCFGNTTLFLSDMIPLVIFYILPLTHKTPVGLILNDVYVGFKTPALQRPII